MTVSAACLFVANTFMIMALRTGEIAVVAPFRYAPVPLALVLGYLWWGDLPDALGFVGIGPGAGCRPLYAASRARRASGRRRRPSRTRSPAE